MDTFGMIVMILVSALLLLLGIVILIGKGDKLIAGYNTASEKEKEQYDIKRLRGLIGGLLIVMAPMTFFSLKAESMAAVGSFIACSLILCIIVVILANTWAKKKNK